MQKPLFLKWMLINVLTTVGAVSGALIFESHVGTIGTTTRVAAGIIAVIYLAMSGYCGKLMWKLDTVYDGENQTVDPDDADTYFGWRKRQITKITHDSEHVYFSVSLLQILGLLGTVTGFLVVMLGGFSNLQNNDPASIRTLLQHVASGSATALLATFVGILTSVVLGLQHHLLMDSIERDSTGTR